MSYSEQEELIFHLQALSVGQSLTKKENGWFTYGLLSNSLRTIYILEIYKIPKAMFSRVIQCLAQGIITQLFYSINDSIQSTFYDTIQKDGIEVKKFLKRIKTKGIVLYRKLIDELKNRLKKYIISDQILYKTCQYLTLFFSKIVKAQEIQVYRDVIGDFDHDKKMNMIIKQDERVLGFFEYYNKTKTSYDRLVMPLREEVKIQEKQKKLEDKQNEGCSYLKTLKQAQTIQMDHVEVVQDFGKKKGNYLQFK